MTVAAATNDTIAAIATPAGRGAIAVVRVSGPDARRIAGACVRPWPLETRVATVARVIDAASGFEADRVLVTWFPAPRSFTGEDLIEVHTHGGATAPAAVLAAIVRLGARPAEPGEFTRRAVLNGKLDIVQAEAIGDLIDAPSSVLHRAAMAQLSGALTARISSLRTALLDVESLLAYDIDFPGEDDGPLDRRRVSESARNVQTGLARLLGTLPVAQLGREGAVVTLAGAPNTGKSSLFNALIGEARAIVTEHPGTTRDAIDVLLEAAPYPWRLVDTAGLRDATDPIERLGVEVSAHWLARADVVLLCGPSAVERNQALAAIAGRTAGAVVPVHTMSDRTAPDEGVLAVSAATGAGLDALRAGVSTVLLERHPLPPADLPVITRARHEMALRHADTEIRDFIAAWDARLLPAPVAATHVRSAIAALDALVGAIDTEDVLGRVFSDFCVGK